jgi:hypothetical protein
MLLDPGNLSNTPIVFEFAGISIQPAPTICWPLAAGLMGPIAAILAR